VYIVCCLYVVLDFGAVVYEAADPLLCVNVYITGCCGL